RSRSRGTGASDVSDDPPMARRSMGNSRWRAQASARATARADSTSRACRWPYAMVSAYSSNPSRFAMAAAVYESRPPLNNTTARIWSSHHLVIWSLIGLLDPYPILQSMTRLLDDPMTRFRPLSYPAAICICAIEAAVVHADDRQAYMRTTGVARARRGPATPAWP